MIKCASTSTSYLFRIRSFQKLIFSSAGSPLIGFSDFSLFPTSDHLLFSFPVSLSPTPLPLLTDIILFSWILITPNLNFHGRLISVCMEMEGDGGMDDGPVTRNFHFRPSPAGGVTVSRGSFSDHSSMPQLTSFPILWHASGTASTTLAITWEMRDVNGSPGYSGGRSSSTHIDAWSTRTRPTLFRS